MTANLDKTSVVNSANLAQTCLEGYFHHGIISSFCCCFANFSLLAALLVFKITQLYQCKLPEKNEYHELALLEYNLSLSYRRTN